MSSSMAFRLSSGLAILSTTSQSVFLSHGGDQNCGIVGQAGALKLSSKGIREQQQEDARVRRAARLRDEDQRKQKEKDEEKEKKEEDAKTAAETAAAAKTAAEKERQQREKELQQRLDRLNEALPLPRDDGSEKTGILGMLNGVYKDQQKMDKDQQKMDEYISAMGWS